MIMSSQTARNARECFVLVSGGGGGVGGGKFLYEIVRDACRLT